MIRITPSVRIRIYNHALPSVFVFMTQNCNRHIYMLTVGRVLTTNVSQISLGQLLSGGTLQVRL